MARNQRQSRPVSDEEYEQMSDRIEEAFDRVRELMAEELGGKPADYESETLDQ